MNREEGRAGVPLSTMLLSKLSDGLLRPKNLGGGLDGKLLLLKYLVEYCTWSMELTEESARLSESAEKNFLQPAGTGKLLWWPINFADGPARARKSSDWLALPFEPVEEGFLRSAGFGSMLWWPEELTMELVRLATGLANELL